MRSRIRWLLSLLHWLPDVTFLRWGVRLETGQRLELDEPVTFGDKLARLKLAMDGQHMARYADKLRARGTAARALGDAALIPLLGVWDRVDQLDWTRLTCKCVLKCTHGSHCGAVYDPATATPAERRRIARLLRRWMARSWFWHGREPPYRWIRPRIIAEEWSADAARDDYKVMVFGGEPMVIQHHRKFGGKHTIDFYDRWGGKMGGVARRGYATTERRQIDPVIASRLSRAARKVAVLVTDRRGRVWPYVRVDMYLVAGQVKFGEITFFDGAGFGTYDPPGMDAWLGKMIPVGAMNCPQCLAPMRWTVSSGEFGMGKIREDTCPGCGHKRTIQLGVGS
ncbi:ATP-grasp fold amidoligase family protein [Bacillota bacterium Meth-B3]